MYSTVFALTNRDYLPLTITKYDSTETQRSNPSFSDKQFMLRRKFSHSSRSTHTTTKKNQQRKKPKPRLWFEREKDAVQMLKPVAKSKYQGMKEIEPRDMYVVEEPTKGAKRGSGGLRWVTLWALLLRKGRGEREREIRSILTPRRVRFQKARLSWHSLRHHHIRKRGLCHQKHRRS